MQANRYKIFIYTALPCEAKPLVEHFKLKKDLSVQPFAVYRNDDLCLTVTGVGKCAMSAGVAYSQALFASVENPILLNIGIAGHRSHALGSVFLIEKIIDGDSRKNYFPPLVFKTACPTGIIQTASRPQLGYDHPYLCDMESSAFYETATRFSSAELVQCLKVISDNQSSPAAYIKPQQVSALIAAHISELEGLLAELIRLAGLITMPAPNGFAELIKRYRFTASEQTQLKNQLNRWDCLTDYQALDLDGISFSRAKDVLIWLEQQIDRRAFSL
jgi:nucleoside phosphorylase